MPYTNQCFLVEVATSTSCSMHTQVVNFHIVMEIWLGQSLHIHISTDGHWMIMMIAHWNLFIFLVHSFWSLVVWIKPACLPEVEIPMCALRLSHNGALRTQWVDMSRVTKTANYYYYYCSNLYKVAHCDLWLTFDPYIHPCASISPN